MNDSKGFTLIELMLTLAVVTILLAMAVPSYRTFVQGNRVASQANTLLRALAYTRSEAVKRAAVIAICRSSNQNSCGGNWAEGWIVFNDVDQDGALDTGTDTLLQAGNGLSGGSTLTAGTGFVRYAASGAAMDTTQFTLTPADCKGDMQRRIQVTGSGQAIIQTASCP